MLTIVRSRPRLVPFCIGLSGFTAVSATLPPRSCEYIQRQNARATDAALPRGESPYIAALKVTKNSRGAEEWNTMMLPVGSVGANTLLSKLAA